MPWDLLVLASFGPGFKMDPIAKVDQDPPADPEKTGEEEESPEHKDNDEGDVREDHDPKPTARAAAQVSDANTPDPISHETVEPRSFQCQNPPESAREMFVGNLSLFTDEQKLRSHFVRFGSIHDVRIMYHNDSNKSRR